MDILLSLTSLIPAGAGDFAFKAAVFIFVLSILVFVHEWGHYAAARSVGVHAEAFSIGFGKELWGKEDKRGCRWKICLIPLGGYVQMKGEGPASGGTKNPDTDSFSSKNVLQRMWVVFAGPLANFVFALVVLCALMLWGEQRALPQVSIVEEGTPAHRAGILEGDIVRAIDDIVVEDFMHMVELISARPAQETLLIVERNGSLIPLQVTPEKIEHTNLWNETKSIGRIGVRNSGEKFTQKRAPIDALKRGVEQTWDIMAGTVKGIHLLITGGLSTDNLSGPIGIADMAGEAAKYGLYPLMMFMVVISINLGLINLFPIPVLDGGHLVLLTLEGIFRRPMPEMVQDWLFRFGFACILLLIGFSTANDLKRVEWLNNLLSSDERVQNDTPSETQSPTR